MTYMIKTVNGWRPWLPLNLPCANSNNLQGVYRPEPIEQVRVSLNQRMKRWINDMQEKETRLSKFAGDHYIEPLHGAFGEKL